MITEIVYLGRDNTIDLVLVADGDVPSLASVTRMTLELEDGSVIDSLQDHGVFDWDQTISAAEAQKVTGAEAGDSKLVISLGQQTLAAGDHYAELVIYDADHEHGITWGTIKLVVKD